MGFHLFSLPRSPFLSLWSPASLSPSHLHSALKRCKHTTMECCVNNQEREVPFGESSISGMWRAPVVLFFLLSLAPLTLSTSLSASYLSQPLKSQDFNLFGFCFLGGCFLVWERVSKGLMTFRDSEQRVS